MNSRGSCSRRTGNYTSLCLIQLPAAVRVAWDESQGAGAVVAVVAIVAVVVVAHVAIRKETQGAVGHG